MSSNASEEKFRDENQFQKWTVCSSCLGRGKKNKRLTKKVKLQYTRELAEYHNSNRQGEIPMPPKAHRYNCESCSGSGLIRTDSCITVDKENYPHLAIIGAGIGGVALAVACSHRGIPFTLYERDESFESRSQGYGLTLQQASKALHGFGIVELNNSVVSSRHLVHSPDGRMLAEWGTRKWLGAERKDNVKRSNLHIARQSLRQSLLQQIRTKESIQWGHQLINFKTNKDQVIDLEFKVDGGVISASADIVVGADGIRSTVRKLLLGDEVKTLRYLGCIVILGICPLDSLKQVDSPLLDSATVFQTANGNERMYVMPFDANSVMWQLSFPMPEEEAKRLSAQGAEALKAEAIKRVPWHDPIPQIVAATAETQVSGYPVYDRFLLESEMADTALSVTLLGDAAHPMSPFKGQGANQALLDALELARQLYTKCQLKTWKKLSIRDYILTDFEENMRNRSASKVKDSADAADFLHSEIALQVSDQPRGTCFKNRTS